MEIRLIGLSVQLGEKTENYTNIPDFEAIMTDYTLKIVPSFWGWGSFHITEDKSYELAKKAMERSLETVEISRDKIDLVIYCTSGTKDDYKKTNQEIGTLLYGLGIKNAQLIGQFFLGCVSVFSAINMARQMIMSKTYNTIMIVTTDKIENGANRYREFGIYSDSASAFILTNVGYGGYKLLSSAVGTDYKLMAGHMETKDSHFQHLNTIHSKVYNDLDFNIDKPTKIFLTNLYKPLLQINIARLGYSKDQTYYDNIDKVGHCFASDPLVNLLNYKEGTESSGKAFVLGAMATGHAGFCVIESDKNNSI